MNEEIRNLDIYKLLYNSRKSIIVFTITMTLCAVIITMPFFITPLYKGEAIISPSGTNSAKLFIERDPKFGGDREIDEQTQILQSSLVRDSMIQKFDLVNRYDVDTSESTGIYELHKEYENSVSVNRTRYNAISVLVYDADAKTAALMANELVALGDKVKNTIIKSNMKQVFKSIEKEYFEKGKMLDQKAAEVNSLLKEKIASGSLIRSKGQVERLKEQIDLKSYIQQSQLTGKNINQLLLLQDYDKLLQEFLDLQDNYLQAFANANSDVPPSYIISPAEMINKKAYPFRSMIVLITAMSSFFVACVAVISSEKFMYLFQRIKS